MRARVRGERWRCVIRDGLPMTSTEVGSRTPDSAFINAVVKCWAVQMSIQTCHNQRAVRTRHTRSAHHVIERAMPWAVEWPCHCAELMSLHVGPSNDYAVGLNGCQCETRASDARMSWGFYVLRTFACLEVGA